MRRWLCPMAAVAVLAACGGGIEASSRGAALAAGDGGDGAFVLVRSGDTLAAVDTGTGEVTFRARGALAAGDGSVVFHTELLGGDRRRLVGLDPASGQPRWTMEVDGRLAVRAAGADGATVALVPGDGGSVYSPAGRERTTIAVARPADASLRTYDLGGNLEPEAFSRDGRSLFVIDYLPPLAPDRYQVRRLDLATGEVVDVFSVDKELQQAMGGTAHSQALAPDGSRLYTLYTVEGRHGREAFVHVLSLDEQWAHCVHLPESFAHTPEEAVALAPSPDGVSLFVADLESGQLAEVDIKALRTVSTSGIPDLPGGRATALVAERNGRHTLYAARGDAVLSAGLGLRPHVERWDVRAPVSGLHLSPEGDRLYLATGDSITVVASSTGRMVSELDLRVGQITDLGVSPPRPDPGSDTIECAC